jgi:hypothetical protein
MLKDAVKLEGLVAVISLLCFWPRWAGASLRARPRGRAVGCGQVAFKWEVTEAVAGASKV